MVTYLEDHEEDSSNSKDYGVADESLARESCNWAWFFYLQHNECEAEGLYCSCQCEDEGELAIAEHEVQDHNDDG